MWLGVAIGGALGALARYGLGGLIGTLTLRTAWAGFPLGTLFINVLGSFALGLVVTLFGRGLLSLEWQRALGVGFLGAFTTFSTFAVDADGLLGRAEWGGAGAYLLGNLGLGLLAVVLGRIVAGTVWR